MKLSQNLYKTGALGRQRTGPTEWIFDQRQSVSASPSRFSLESSPATLNSLKVSPRGWRLLTSILRLNG